MKPFESKSVAALAAVVLLLATFAGLNRPAEAGQAAWAATPATHATFLQASVQPLAWLPPTAPALQGPGLPSSVIPPLPAPGAICSVDTPNTFCSAVANNQNCSAQNDNGNQCSTFGFEFGSECSVAAPNQACSVLPPVSPDGIPSQCSTFALEVGHRCSAIGLGNNLRCSAKSRGVSQCSTFGSTPAGGPSFCSVLNVGSPARSFCSTKFNVPEIAKGCSAFADVTECSVELGGRGVCTTFGQADPTSCSAFTPAAQCSVIGGGPGNPCAQ